MTNGTQTLQIWKGTRTRVMIRTDRNGGIMYRVEEKTGDRWRLFSILGNKSCAIQKAEDLDSRHGLRVD